MSIVYDFLGVSLYTKWCPFRLYKSLIEFDRNVPYKDITGKKAQLILTEFISIEHGVYFKRRVYIT